MGCSVTAGGAGAVLRAAALVEGRTSVQVAGALVGWLEGPGVGGVRAGWVEFVRCGVVGCEVGPTLGGGAWMVVCESTLGSGGGVHPGGSGRVSRHECMMFRRFSMATSCSVVVLKALF